MAPALLITLTAGLWFVVSLLVLMLTTSQHAAFSALDQLLSAGDDHSVPAPADGFLFSTIVLVAAAICPSIPSTAIAV